MTSSNGSASSEMDISFPTNRPTEPGKWTPELDAEIRAREPPKIQLRGSQAPAPNVLSTDFFPHGKRSLSGIAVRAFCLGMALMLGLVMAAFLAYYESRLWRPWLFLSTLSTFHFLEFYTTAAYNTPKAWVASFLLTNGDQYRQAHTMAFIETCVTTYFFPSWQAKVHTPVVFALGIVLVVVGQAVRSFAMVQAGTNFNHTVQSKKNDDHELVTTGLYTYFRHPSYFGFFWWGVGTQVMLGNTVCFLGYAAVLWYFFSRRISRKSQPTDPNHTCATTEK
jgi:protein-S-isoprenylcysteine O-methyltransferase